MKGSFMACRSKSPSKDGGPRAAELDLRMIYASHSCQRPSLGKLSRLVRCSRGGYSGGGFLDLIMEAFYRGKSRTEWMLVKASRQATHYGTKRQ